MIHNAYELLSPAFARLIGLPLEFNLLQAQLQVNLKTNSKLLGGSSSSDHSLWCCSSSPLQLACSVIRVSALRQSEPVLPGACRDCFPECVGFPCWQNSYRATDRIRSLLPTFWSLGGQVRLFTLPDCPSCYLLYLLLGCQSLMWYSLLLQAPLTHI